MNERFSRTIATLNDAFSFVDRFLERYDVPPRHHYMVRFVVEELFTNVVRHGSGKGDVGIELAATDGRMSIAVTDFDAEPYDITKRPDVDVDRPIEEREPGGLGVHLIRTMSDTVEYTYENRNSTVTVTKTIEDEHA